LIAGRFSINILYGGVSMKSAALALSLIALVAARGVESTPSDTNELSVKASGLN